jgi:hypothetical protein
MFSTDGARGMVIKRELEKNEMRRLASRPLGTLNRDSLVLRVVCSRLSCLKKEWLSALGSSTGSSESCPFAWCSYGALSRIFVSTNISFVKSHKTTSYRFCKRTTTCPQPPRNSIVAKHIKGVERHHQLKHPLRKQASTFKVTSTKVPSQGHYE